MKRALLIFPLLLLLTACAGHQARTPEQQLPGGIVYPPLSLFYKHPSDQLRQECASFRARSLLHHCNENAFDLTGLHKALSESGKFQQLALAQNEQDYQALISIAVLDEESGTEIGNAALSGATLMMLPIAMEKTIRAELVVTWREIPIRTYDYSIPFRFSASIFSSDGYQQTLTAAIAERFLEDLEQENIFTGSYLMKALNASDYEQDLNVPDSVGDYVLDEKYIHNNPFFGAMLTFQHRQFAFDRAEVFIYPIRRTEWTDTEAVTREEADNLRSDLELMQREGQLKSVVSGEIKPLQWNAGQNVLSGSFYTNTLTDNDDQQARTANYIFTSGDKFVRVHAFFPIQQGSASVGNPDDFVRELLHTISLPVESRFMARLREQYRQSETGI